VVRREERESVTVFTVDVSHHDWDRRGGNLDWRAVRAAGVQVACVRATYGDPAGWYRSTRHFADMAGSARVAGLTVGGYHNLTRGDGPSIVRQVGWFKRELDAVGAEWAMLDVERYSELVTAGLWPRWDDVREFDDHWAAVDDRPLAVYLPHWNWSDYLGKPDLRVLRGPLVSSRYPLGDTTADYASLYSLSGGDAGAGWAGYGNVTPTLWQFTSHGYVPGATGATDCNAYRGTLSRLISQLTGGDDMTAEQTANDLMFGWSVLTGARAALYPNEQPGARVDVGNPLWDMLRAIAAKVDVSPTELAAITEAAHTGAESGVLAASDDLVAAILTHLPEGTLTRVDVEAAATTAIRTVLGGLDNTPSG
jgi:GH25 family lysozyme M1 (1,4-beta-N-acetylmuramidase)